MNKNFFNNIILSAISAVLLSILSNIIISIDFKIYTLLAGICLTISIVSLVLYTKTKFVKEDEAKLIIEKEVNPSRKRIDEIYRNKFSQVKVQARIYGVLVILFLLLSILLIAYQNHVNNSQMSCDLKIINSMIKTFHQINLDNHL
ncbi:MAG: hypothetical protein QY331_02030 [Melioribacteraceae bacterium]|nr:MAG: hypothetical protein QY331_02030 [Melioribacteraceae bacterium]